MVSVFFRQFQNPFTEGIKQALTASAFLVSLLDCCNQPGFLSCSCQSTTGTAMRFQAGYRTRFHNFLSPVPPCQAFGLVISEI